jgi:hypothetical protein
MALRASGGMPLRPGAFPFLSLAMARLILLKVIGVNFGEAWLLGNEFEDGVINWSVVIKDIVEVHAEDGHIFFCIGGKVTIVEFHGHINVGFVV